MSDIVYRLTAILTFLAVKLTLRFKVWKISVSRELDTPGHGFVGLIN